MLNFRVATKCLAVGKEYDEDLFSGAIQREATRPPSNGNGGLSGSESVVGCFSFKVLQLHYGHPTGGAVFMNLSVCPAADASKLDAPPLSDGFIPCGRLIGLRIQLFVSDAAELSEISEALLKKPSNRRRVEKTPSRWQAVRTLHRRSVATFPNEMPALTFLKLLSGAIRPISGTVAVNPYMRVKMVPQDPWLLLFDGSLRQNLLCDVPADRPPVDDRALWNACHHAGLDNLIGDEYASTWGDVVITRTDSMLHPADLSKVLLVRTLLSEPDVLLVCKVRSPAAGSDGSCTSNGCETSTSRTAETSTLNSRIPCQHANSPPVLKLACETTARARHKCPVLNALQREMVFITMTPRRLLISRAGVRRLGHGPPSRAVCTPPFISRW